MIAFLVTALLSLFTADPVITVDKRRHLSCRYVEVCVLQYQRPETAACVDVGEVCR